MALAFDNLAGEQRVEGRLAFARINLAETPDIGEKYGINAVPAYMVLVDGKKPAESQEEFTLRRADPMALRHMASSWGRWRGGLLFKVLPNVTCPVFKTDS